jgi:hypothetical protein
MTMLGLINCLIPLVLAKIYDNNTYDRINNNRDKNTRKVTIVTISIRVNLSLLYQKEHNKELPSTRREDVNVSTSSR